MYQVPGNVETRAGGCPGSSSGNTGDTNMCKSGSTKTASSILSSPVLNPCAETSGLLLICHKWAQERGNDSFYDVARTFPGAIRPLEPAV